MSKNRFTDVCLFFMVCFLGLIALRLDTTPIYAAKKFRYEVVSVFEGTANQNVAAQVDKETQAGWELVAAPIWREPGTGRAEGFLIFRK
jgi:hypothetical protein